MALALTALPAHAAPAFEAYYKFYLGNTHSGYIIQRFEVLDAKKEMVSTYYTYVKTPQGPSIESLVAHADLNFEPISYSYTSLSEGKPKTIDAVFKLKKMTAKITEGGKTKTVSLTVPANGFLSTFLNYVILKNGLAANKGYTFYALSEEDPAFRQGTANIISEQKVKNKIDAFKVNITYKDVTFTALIASNGEPLGTNSPDQNASYEMVATRAEAVASLPFNEKQIRTVFGNIPEGKHNKMSTPDTEHAPAKTLLPPATLSTGGDKPGEGKPKGQ